MKNKPERMISFSDYALHNNEYCGMVQLIEKSDRFNQEHQVFEWDVIKTVSIRIPEKLGNISMCSIIIAQKLAELNKYL